MKSNVWKRLASVVAALAIVFGCDSAVNTGEAPNAPTTGRSTGIESDFTDAPVSPGGTGGTLDNVVEGTEDVDMAGEETRSFFTAFQIDPVAEDTAGPKFVISADIDQDGLLDLVSAWNQNQPVQIHLQRRDPEGIISFRTITLAGTTPLAVIAGVEVGQINDDGWLDIVVLSKATGFITLCPTSPPKVISRLEGEIIVLFSPGSAASIPDGDQWTEMILVNPFVRDRWIHNQFPGNEAKSLEVAKVKPEWSGFTALVVANIDGQPGDDIIVALNPGECDKLGQKPPLNTVDLWVNPGPGQAEISAAWGAPPPGLSRGVPVTLIADGPQVKDIGVMDVDDDGDLDIVSTWTNAVSQNVRWVRNPLIPHEPGGPSGSNAVIAGFRDDFDFCIGGANDELDCPNGAADCPDGLCSWAGWWFFATEWEERPIGSVDTAADVMALGDVDNDGSSDVLMRSTNGQIIQWFRRPNKLGGEPEFPPPDPVPDRFNFPWTVFTLTEFTNQEPEAIALGDITGDGKNEVLVAVEGGVFWYDGSVGNSRYDPWFPNAIIQDSPAETTDATVEETEDGEAPGSGVGVEKVDVSTHINELLIVDLDGDGKNDIVGTLDRRTGSGLSDDRLVWYRNTRTEPEE